MSQMSCSEATRYVAYHIILFNYRYYSLLQSLILLSNFNYYLKVERRMLKANSEACESKTIAAERN